MRRLVLAVSCVALAACDAGDAGPPRIATSTPPHGPLVGGTRVTITGDGFAAPGAPTRVLIGGREAPLVATVDDGRLEVVIPPGAQPGDAELVVWNDAGNGRATGVFRYSTPPTITAVTPARVLASSTSTRITVTGTGFEDEDAGTVVVALDGLPVAAEDVLVRSDTTLTFTSPPGRPLVRPDVEVFDDRGRAIRTRAFQLVPSLRPGLIVFHNFGAFATYVDPTDRSTVTIPRGGGFQRFTAVVRDDHGDYWAVDRNGSFGRIDMKTQLLEAPVETGRWIPTMTRVGDEHLALERGEQRLGRFDPLAGTFTALGDEPVPCCGSYGLASDGIATYVTVRQAGVVSIRTVDRATGALGPAVPLAGTSPIHVEEMRFFGGTLYATNRNGTLLTIDPRTGATATVPVTIQRASAISLFD